MLNVQCWMLNVEWSEHSTFNIEHSHFNIRLHMKRALSSLLYATIPAAVALQFMHVNLVAQFVLSCVAVLPLAAWIGASTEQLAHRMGPTYGALFNATFGNFAEMVIAIFAIRAGLDSVVRASLSGSILGNLLFVAGASMI